MKILETIFLFILCVILTLLCLKLIFDAAMPEYTVLYKMDNGKRITLGVRDNVTDEVIEATPENLKLSKGDIDYVSPMCDVYNRKLICN